MVMGPALSLALVMASLPGGDHPAPAEDPCALFEVPADRKPGAVRPISAMDLVRIADIGRSDPNPSASQVAVSPDGKDIAFLVKRATPQANAVCQRLIIAALDGRGEAREIARGGGGSRHDFAWGNV